MIQPNSLHEEQPPMLDIVVVFTWLREYVAPTTLRQLRRVTEAMLSMTGRVTMKGLSRWTDQGGSYRTVQRFFNTSISWCKLQWVLIRHHLLEPDDVIVMGGDEVVVTKSGKQTHGLDRFFSLSVWQSRPGAVFFEFIPDCCLSNNFSFFRQINFLLTCWRSIFSV